MGKKSGAGEDDELERKAESRHFTRREIQRHQSRHDPTSETSTVVHSQGRSISRSGSSIPQSETQGPLRTRLRKQVGGSDLTVTSHSVVGAGDLPDFPHRVKPAGDISLELAQLQQQRDALDAADASLEEAISRMRSKASSEALLASDVPAMLPDPGTLSQVQKRQYETMEEQLHEANQSRDNAIAWVQELEHLLKEARQDHGYNLPQPSHETDLGAEVQRLRKRVLALEGDLAFCQCKRRRGCSPHCCSSASTGGDSCTSGGSRC